MRLLQEHPQRMARERQLLDAHARATPGFTVRGWTASAGNELCMNFELKFLSFTFAGMLVYPELFPDVPAFIRPQKAGESWSAHQYFGSGVLCLQFGPDNWHRDITGVQLVQSASSLIWGELLHVVLPEFGPVPSRHEETRAQRLRDHKSRLLVSSALKAVLSAAGRAAPIPLRGLVDWRGDESVVLLNQAGEPLTALADVPAAVAEGPGVPVSGVAVAVPTIQALLKAKDVTELQTQVGGAWPWGQGVGDRLQLLLAHDEKDQACAFLLKGGEAPIFQQFLELGHVADRLGGDNSNKTKRLPISFEKLAGVSVTIVGLGSLGSKIAVSLARAGVQNFVLVDDDVLMPENLVRNEFNWVDVGFSKLQAADRALKLVAPDVSVSKWPMQVAAQGNPAVSAMLSAAVANCTLVVDATANSGAFLALAAITKRAGKAMVWGEVFGGGGGALMARSRPGLDTDALGVRNHLRGILEEMAPAPQARASAYGIEADGQVYVASDADVSSLAASMTQFCLDTLCAEQSEYPAAAYLIGFRKFWEFRCPFDVIPVDCPRALEPEPKQALSAQEQEAVDEIKKSIQGRAGAADNGAS